jgi:magnesium-transporting ATPase (P-type)
MAGMNMLCSDKTGTLTKNELTLGDSQPAPGAARDGREAGVAARYARRDRLRDRRRRTCPRQLQ